MFPFNPRTSWYSTRKNSARILSVNLSDMRGLPPDRCAATRAGICLNAGGYI